MNPVEEAQPTSLSDLFEKDPLSLSEKDLETIVASLREARKNFNAAPAKKAKSPKGIDIAGVSDILGI